MIRERLGRYRLLGSLGRGGMGHVFLAEDPSLGRRVAIKVLPPEFASDPERRARLLHEARAASALNHPNILTVYDLGEEEGVLFVATEVVEGDTVGVWAGREPRTPLQVLGVVRQAARALAQAHAAGLVHRDIKPENLMVRPDGLVKVLDFGLARSMTPGELGGATETLPGTVVGTAAYMSPEQVLGRPAGPPSDVFSLGTVLYELLTGRHPFAASSAVETMHRILHDSPEPPTRLNARLSPDFDFVLAKALTKDPTRRHQSARDLEIDLETLECGCGAAPAAADRGEGEPRAIAVLPFKNLGGDPDLNYLGIGLADAVITRLSGSPDLIVRPTSAVAHYGNQPVDPRRVGRELEVTAVLDASFQRAGERFRATARLLETPQGRALWAGKVDLRFEDIFEVQDQVAQGIADALTARVTSAAGASGRGRYTPSAEAYDLVVRAQAGTWSGTREAVRDAMRLLERAVALEPGYAEAWSHLATYYHSMVDSGFESDPVWYEKCEQALRKALELDPDLPSALYARGRLQLVRGDKRGAYRDLTRALSRMPHDPVVNHYFAYLFRLSGMLEEGVKAELHAIDLGPGLPWAHAGMVRLKVLLGDTAGARDHLERAKLRLGPHSRLIAIEQTVLRAEGRCREVLEHLRRHGRSMDELYTTDMDVAFCQVRTGEVEAAMATLSRLEEFGRVDMDGAAGVAAVHALLGGNDEAFGWLDRAVSLGNDCLPLYLNNDFYGPLHADARWEPFLGGVRRRVAEWKREFRWPPA